MTGPSFAAPRWSEIAFAVGSRWLFAEVCRDRTGQQGGDPGCTQAGFRTGHDCRVRFAKIYRDRWQIETFFKALKQSLRVKTFVGTSANALKTQIWTALIAMLILKYLKLRSTFGGSLSNLVALLRHQLFLYRDLWTWLDCQIGRAHV